MPLSSMSSNISPLSGDFGAKPNSAYISLVSWFAYHEGRHIPDLESTMDALESTAEYDDTPDSDYDNGFRIFGFNAEVGEDCQQKLASLLDGHHFIRQPDGAYAYTDRIQRIEVDPAACEARLRELYASFAPQP